MIIIDDHSRMASTTDAVYSFMILLSQDVFKGPFSMFRDEYQMSGFLDEGKGQLPDTDLCDLFPGETLISHSFYSPLFSYINGRRERN